MLFNIFLDSERITRGQTLVFNAEVAISTTDYEIDGLWMFDRKIPSEYLLRDTITVRARLTKNGWTLRYILSDEDWGEGRGHKAERSDSGFYIPLQTRKGFKAK